MTSSTIRAEPARELAVVDLRCQLPAGVAAGAEPIRLTWRIEPATPGLIQQAYEVQASAMEEFEAISDSSGIVESADQVGIPAPGRPLRSREVRVYRVRIRTADRWTDWSPLLRVEAGLLAADDWAAKAVTLPDDPGQQRQAPSPVLRREFEVAGDVIKARLYVTSLGVYRITLNGVPISDELLAPGWTAYRQRLVVDSHNVTSHLRAGSNVIVATLGDGWYRGRLGFDPEDDRCKYGRDVALLAQLEMTSSDGTVQRVVTDEDWLASTAEIRSADLYDGSAIDLRERKEGSERTGYDTSGWLPATVVSLDPGLLEARMAPPVRVVETIAGPARPQAVDGVLYLDAGQNISGHVRLRVQGRRGDRVRVRHAEVLEPDGSLHTTALRSAKATDTYVLADDKPTILEPAFTFHGFRYAEVETEARILAAEFDAISSDLPRRGTFECSDPRLTRLHDNVVWSQRDNFVSVPTDCPQRDERLGWTGDAQAFAPTACTLFDSEAFLASWLVDLALEQDDELGVPSVVPDVVLGGDLRYGRAGWADAATMVPWAVFESYGDPHILRTQLDSMKRWVDSLDARAGADGLLGESWQFGDWLDPDAPVERPWEAKADSTYLANAFFAHSARLLADAARVLGEDDIASAYERLAGEVADATWARWADHAASNQTGAAIALRFGLVPAAERAELAAALARLVRESDGRVATGFLGTPHVLPALAAEGYFDEAYRMLLRTEVPSWLYQVEQGATTVWERWDAIRPDGSIHPGTMRSPSATDEGEAAEGHMLSFNHYAYGAVIDWVYRHVAGLAPDVEQPGYRRVLFAPRPAVSIEWARAAVDSPYGRVSIEWRTESVDTFSANVELPFGTSGTFIAPATEASQVRLDGESATERMDISHGRHTITVTRPLVAGALGGQG